MEQSIERMAQLSPRGIERVTRKEGSEAFCHISWDSEGAASVPHEEEQTARRSAAPSSSSFCRCWKRASLSSPITARAGCRTRRASSGPKDHRRKAGSSCSKNVGASAIARSRAPGTARSRTERLCAPHIPRRNVSTAAVVSPARYSSRARGTSGGLGTAISAGSRSASD